jgi:hypothetical protein
MSGERNSRPSWHVTGPHAREILRCRLTTEARSEWAPPERRDGDGGVEERLFARIEAFERQEPRPVPRLAEVRWLRPVAMLAAVAACALFFTRVPGSGPRPDADSATASPTVQGIAAPVAEPARPAASAALAMMTGKGELHGDDGPALPRGATLSDGERLEARGGEALFSAPGRVDWRLEQGTEVRVVRAGAQGGAIILALAVGAVEAQVKPVAAGEAFAVDVDGVRVAVHGTHLRVARGQRGGSAVVVDLTEGVILVGAPPRAGSTMGTLVNAPAHVELSVDDLAGTLRIDHEPSHVRPAVDQAALMAQAGAPAVELLHPVVVTPEPVPVPTPVTPPRSTSAPPVPRAPSPLEIVDAAVHTCADQTIPGASGTVTISSTLTVSVKLGGQADVASFNPPLVPEFQSCVARAVYSVRWTEPGPHLIPIEVHR